MAGVGLALPYLQSALGPGQRGLYRQALLWTLPLLVGALAWLLVPRPPAHPDPAAALRNRWTYGVAAGAAWAVGLAAVAIGFGLRWLTFTYGDQGLWTNPWKSALWALPGCCLVGVVGWEFGLRRTLYLSLAGRPAWAATLLAGTALAWPSIAPGGMPPDRDFAVAALAVALAHETIFTRLFVRGGLVLAGLARGASQYLDGFVLNDWLSPHFPAVNYASSHPAFYGLRAGLALAALGLFLALTRRLDRRAWA